MFPQTISNDFKARRIAGVALLTATGWLGACSDQAGSPNEPEPVTTLPAHEVKQVEAPNLPRMFNSSPSLSACGTVQFTLTDLRQKAGTVTVSNDASTLYVVYAVTEKDWYMSDTRLAVTKSVQTIPMDSKKLPNPWLFPYKGVHQPVITNYTYTVPLAQIGAAPGTKLVIAAMAGLVHPKTSSLSGPWEWLVMWGLGNLGGKDLETLHNYTVASCGSVTPPPVGVSGGAWTITFDDGFATTHSVAFPILKEYGMKANVAINADPIDGAWTSYLTLAQVKDLHAAGWDMVSHTLSHRNMTTLTDAELQRELRDNKAWIERNGFRGSHVFIVPFHSWGPRERAAIQQHYRSARGFSSTQFWPERLVKSPVTQKYDITGYEPEFAPFTTAEGRKLTLDQVERAVKEGEFIDIFFHTVTPAQGPAFRELIKVLAPYKGNLKTWTQVIP